LGHSRQKKTKIGKAETENYKESHSVMKVILCPTEGVKMEFAMRFLCFKVLEEKLVLKI
jgi:hypothetical protein